MSGAEEVLDDLRAENGSLDSLVAGLPAERWRTPTPAPGWTVAHQIAHLAWTDARTLLAVRDADAFRQAALAALDAPDTFVDAGAEAGAARPVPELLADWRTGRTELLTALAEVPRGRRLPWYGPSMSAAGMATARLMETWAHGEDIADALGVHREPTARLRHVVWIGFRTRDFAYVVHGMEPPAEPFRVELRAPDGASWSHGPEDAAQRVTGPALDFCRLVTQRTHRTDTALHTEGDEAEHWLTIAQSFAGPPGPGRAPHGAEATR